MSNCAKLISVKIGENVVTIGDSAFSSSKLTEIIIPNSVMRIGDSAFSNCGDLNTVTIGNSVKIIGSQSFQLCTSLTSVVIGTGIEEIHSSAFDGCISLETVTILAETPPTLGTQVFVISWSDLTILPNLRIEVLSDSVNAYRNNTDWSELADRIYSITP